MLTLKRSVALEPNAANLLKLGKDLVPARMVKPVAQKKAQTSCVFMENIAAKATVAAPMEAPKVAATATSNAAKWAALNTAG